MAINNWNNGKPSFDYEGHANLGVNLNRQKNAPLDVSTEYKSIKDMLFYVTEGRYPAGGTGVSQWVKDMAKYPYLGQVIALVDVNTPEKVTLYYVKTAESPSFVSTTDEAVFSHYFAEVGKATVGDEKGIHLDASSGTLSLKNYGVEYYKWIPKTDETEGRYEKQIVDDQHPWIAGLEPRVASENSKLFLAWYEPNTETVSGLQSAVATLRTEMDTVKGTASTTGSIAAAKKAGDDAQTSVNALSAVVGADDNTGLRARIKTNETDIATLKSTVGDSTTGLVKGLADETSARSTKDTELEGRIQNLEARGRFLSSWDATTGKPTTEPTAVPYLLKSGDYFIVSKVGTANLQPEAKTVSGKEGLYYTGDASVTTESRELGVGDFYTFDGTKYVLIQNTTKTINWGSITGTLANQTDLQGALDNKVDKVTGSRLMTSEEGTKLAGIATGAQVNVIEKIKLNGTDLTPDADKRVDLGTIATSEELETVKGRVTTLETTVGGTGSGLVKGLADEITNRESADNTLSGRIADFETSGTHSVSALETRVTGVEARVTGVEASITTLQGDVTGLQGKVTGITGTIKEYVDAGDSGLQTQITSLGNTKADKTQVASDISTAKSELIGTTASASSTSTIYGAKAFATDAVSTAKSELKGVYATASSTDETIAGAKKYADSLNSEVGTKVTALEGLHANKTGGGKQTVAEEVSSGVITLENSLAAVAKSGKASDVSVKDDAGKITATNVEGALAELVDEIDTNTTGISAINTKIGTVPTDKTVIGLIGENTSGISAVNDKIGTLPTGSTVISLINTNTSGITALGTRMTTAEGKVSTLEGLHADSATTGVKKTVAQEVTAGIDALDLPNTYDAKGSAATAKSEAISEIKGTGTITGFDTLTAIKGKIEEVQTNVGINASGIATINTKIGTVPTGSTVIELINANTTGLAAAQASITGINTTIGADDTTGLRKRIATNEGNISTIQTNVTALKTTVGDSGSGLVKGLADEITRATTAESALSTRTTALETAVGNTGSGLIKGLADEASTREAADTALSERIESLESRGRFLSSWNVGTGVPSTYPTIPSGASYPYSYNYRAGDYYIVGTVPSSGDKYQPSGSSLTKASAEASWTVPTTAETREVGVGDYYTYDGTKWVWVANSQKTVNFRDIAGSATDNTSLNTELGKKVDKVSGKSLVSDSEITKLEGVSTGANKVEASTTNGNIKIDGAETTVYTEVANTVHDANYQHISVTTTSVTAGTGTTAVTFNKYDDTALAGRVTAAEGNISSLTTAVAGKADKTYVDTELGKKQNTITSSNKVSADYIDDSSATNKFVTASEKAEIAKVTDKADKSYVDTELAKKVDVVDGSRLMTTAEGTKLAGIATGAEVNVIDSIKIAGETSAITVTNKQVELPLATASRCGLVKVDNTSIEVSDAGVIGVKAVNVQKLFVATGDEFILDGGSAT